ncbi:hypothetical protein D3C76_1002840 [compost metagenome]
MENNELNKNRVKKTKTKVSDNKGIGKIIKNYLSFYNKELRKKHILIYVVSLILFAIFTTSVISDVGNINTIQTQANNFTNSGNTSDKDVFNSIITQKIPISLLLIFAGITPFAYIPVLGIVLAPYILAGDIANVINGSYGVISILSLSVSAVLQLIGIGLAIATGVYYCNNATKRFRYSQGGSMGIDDVKDQYYQIRKDEKNLEKLQLKRQQKLEKKEKLNVKIDYFNMLISAVVSVIIVSVATLISIL